ncbi:hypothetical protein D3C72_1097440 [compost metagenome]
MIERCQQRAGGFVVEAAFDTHCALANGRQALFRAQWTADTLFQPQALKPGDRQNNGVVIAVIQFCQPGTDVAAQIAHDQIRTALTQLALTTQAGGTDHAALRQLIERCETIGNKCVARIVTLANSH